MKLSKKVISANKNKNNNNNKYNNNTKKNNKREIEIRVLNIDVKKIRDILNKTRKAKLIQPKRLMKVSYYKHPKGNKDSLIRLRDEGNQLTLTIKTKLKSKYVIERQVVIDNEKEAEAILNFLGCELHYKVEKFRELWSFGGCDNISFDTYPGLPTYMEIDCKSMNSLKYVSRKLGYSPKDHQKKTAKHLYEDNYSIKLSNKQIYDGAFTFKKAKKIVRPLVKKNIKLYDSLLSHQLKYINNKLDLDKPNKKEEAAIVAIRRPERFGGINPIDYLKKKFYKYFNNKVELEKTGLSIVYKKLKKDIINEKSIAYILYGHYKLRDEIPLRVYIKPNGETIVLSVKQICKTLLDEYFNDKKEREKLIESSRV
tara:strand:- start:168 stop:1274 length:1107 start_codon:yes stop_codon:yes gene_type:complete